MNRNNVIQFLPDAQTEREESIIMDEDQGQGMNVELPIARRMPQGYAGLSGLGDDNLLSFGGLWAAFKRSWKPLFLGAIIGGTAIYLEGRYGYVRDLLKI